MSTANSNGNVAQDVPPAAGAGGKQRQENKDITKNEDICNKTKVAEKDADGIDISNEDGPKTYSLAETDNSCNRENDAEQANENNEADDDDDDENCDADDVEEDHDDEHRNNDGKIMMTLTPGYPEHQQYPHTPYPYGYYYPPIPPGFQQHQTPLYPPYPSPYFHPHATPSAYQSNTNNINNNVNTISASGPLPNARRNRGGVAEPFPEKLHRMLEACAKEGKADVASFFSHGRAFAIHKPRRFVNEIMPNFFKQSKLTSFQRQLNLYGFRRISAGVDNGGYWHPLFLKDRPILCSDMKRVKIKGDHRPERDLENEPNFYVDESAVETADSNPSLRQQQTTYPPDITMPGYHPPFPVAQGYGFPPQPWASPYYPMHPPPGGTPPRSMTAYSPYAYQPTNPYYGYSTTPYGYPTPVYSGQMPLASPVQPVKDDDDDANEETK